MFGTKGYYACTHCGDQLQAWHLKDFKKMFYEGHINFFFESYFHESKERELVNGKKDIWPPPVYNTPTNWLNLSNGYLMYGESPNGMNRLSKLYELPCWRDLHITHLLGSIHIFKDIYTSFWRYVLFEEMTNNLSTRIDLKESDTKKYTWTKYVERRQDQHTLIAMRWLLNKNKVQIVKNVIFTIMNPTKYDSPLKKSFIVDGHVTDLKSHDHCNQLKVCYSISLL